MSKALQEATSTESTEEITQMIVYIADQDKSSILYAVGMAIDNEEDKEVKHQLEQLEIRLTEDFYEQTSEQLQETNIG